MPGYRGVDLLRRAVGDEVEFQTMMWFDSLAAVKDFAGEDHEAAYVPDAARAVLERFDARARHYEVRAWHGPDAAAGDPTPPRFS